MLTDDDNQIRTLGLKKIQEARILRQDNTIRSYVIPKINFESHDYHDMIDWQDKNLSLTEPPLLQFLEIRDIEKIINEVVKTFDFTKFPCHTQSVERGVKITTEAASSVAGNKAREGFIAAKINSRQIMPKFNSKKDFN